MTLSRPAPCRVMTQMDRDVERSLVDRLRAGDTSAFDDLYEAYRPRVFSFLLRMSRSRTVAEDLLDETWLRLVRHARALQPDTRIGPWLFTVARNLHVSYCRTRAVESQVATSLSLWPVRAAETPFDIAARTEFEQRLDAALGDLPVTLREAILLVGVEGMRPAEAAAVCEITSEAMRQRLRRARTLLAERLGYTMRELRLRTGA